MLKPNDLIKFRYDWPGEYSGEKIVLVEKVEKNYYEGEPPYQELVTGKDITDGGQRRVFQLYYMRNVRKI